MSFTTPSKIRRYKVIMQGKLFQSRTYLLYCSVLSLGRNVNTRRMFQPDMGSIFHIKNLKYSGHRKLLCELSKFSKFNAFILLPCIITFVQSNYVYCIMSCNACSTLKFEVNVLGLQTYTNTHSLIKNWVVLRCPTCLMLE